jgi:transcriptional regulator GlxA family with amidase domain
MPPANPSARPSRSPSTPHSPRPARARAGHQVLCLLFPGCMSLDVTGPMQVFATANDMRAQHGLAPWYRLGTLGVASGLVATSSGLRLQADRAWGEADLTRNTTLLVPGGDGINEAQHDAALREWLQQASAHVLRLGSVCSGALVLGRAGLLQGLPATTHWSRIDELRNCCPGTVVDADRLHTFDAQHPQLSRRFTSAGVTAGIDLALALVEADLGRPLALAVARQLVMFMRRPGGQAQFSPLLSADAAHAPRLARLLEWIPGQIGADLSVEQLARQACLPPRTLARVFQKELQTTPARYVERVRLEAASALLAQPQAGVATVARLCGFGHPETLRRAFHKHLAISPQAFAERFGCG